MNHIEEQLTVAVVNEDLDKLEALLHVIREQGVLPGTQKLFHQICEFGWVEGLALALTLPDKAAMLNAFDSFSRTPLLFAVQQDSLAMIDLLLKAGADVNAHDENMAGNTALIEAVDAEEEKVVEALLRAGADPTIRGWMGANAVDKARLRVEKTPTPENRKVLELIAAKR